MLLDFEVEAEAELPRLAGWCELGVAVGQAEVGEDPTHHARAPEGFRLLREAAQIYDEKMKLPERAFVVLKSALARDCANEVVAGQLQRFVFRLGASDELLQTYALLASDDQRPMVKARLLMRAGCICEQTLRDRTRAEEFFLLALKADEKHAGALATLDRVYARSGMSAELAEILRRRVLITKLGPEAVALRLRLGKLYEAELDPSGEDRTCEAVREGLDRASAVYQQIVELDSDNGEAPAALQRLRVPGHRAVPVPQRRRR